MSDGLDQRAFRNALGSFATGVTIVTTLDNFGEPVGVTASSFNSVSLDPPLVLWSLSKRALSHEAFCRSGHFAIHVLNARQEELSNRFARSGANKFEGVDWEAGALGSPLLKDWAARFQCKLRDIYEGGDHAILIGEVVDFDVSEAEPLLFHGGSYAERRVRPSPPGVPAVDVDRGHFNDDFLLYLVSRAHFQASRPIRELLSNYDLSMQDYLTIAFLSMEGRISCGRIHDSLRHTGYAPAPDDLARLCCRGYIALDDDIAELTDEGRKILVKSLAYGKLFEEELAKEFSMAELSDVKRVLKAFIDITGNDVPIEWRDPV